MNNPLWALPRFPLTTEMHEGREMVYDPARRDWFVLQPEEEVRQHLLRWLVETKGVPMGLVAVEKEITYRGTRRRFDLVVFDRRGLPWLLCECKAPEAAITQDTVNQIARYNVALQAPHLLVTNGHLLLVFSRNEQGRLVQDPDWQGMPG